MKQKQSRAATVLVLIMLYAPPLFASGIGISFHGGGGQFMYSGSDFLFTQGPYAPLQEGMKFYGGNLVFDTSVAKDRVFNYRLGLGADSFSYNNLSRSKNLFRANIVNTFGLGFVRTEDLRVWIGPQFGMHCIAGPYIDGSDDFYYYSMLSYSGDPAFVLYLMNQETERIEYTGSFSLGLALGFNIHFGSAVSFAIDFGFRYGFVVPIFNSYLPRDTQSIEGFGEIGFIFRIRDNYSARAKKKGDTGPARKPADLEPSGDIGTE